MQNESEGLYSIVDDDNNVIESDLSLKDAEILLCRYCNEGEDYYLCPQP